MDIRSFFSRSRGQQKHNALSFMQILFYGGYDLFVYFYVPYLPTTVLLLLTVSITPLDSFSYEYDSKEC